MAEEFKYTLTFDSRATGNGAQQAAAGVKAVSTAAATFNEKVSAARWGTYNLDAELKRTAGTAANFAGALKTANSAAAAGGQGLSKMGGLANQASLQVGDFFTQVSMGTGVMRAFSMQAPQLLGSLSMAGVIAGPAAIAIGAIGAALPLLAMAFGNAGEKAEAFKVDLDQIAQNSADNLAEKFEEELEDMNAVGEAAEAQRQTWDKTRTAANEAATAQLDNAGKIAEAQRIVNEALGVQIDQYLEIKRLAEEERLKKTLAAQQEAEAAVRAEKEARYKFLTADEKRANQATVLARMKNELDEVIQKLDAARAKRDELQKIIERDKPPEWFSQRAPALSRQYHVEADAAKEQLASDAVQGPLKALEAQMTRLQEEIRRGARAETGLRNLAEKAAKEYEDQTEATRETLERIGQTLPVDELLSKAKEVEALDKERAATMQGILDKIQPATEAQSAVKEQALALLADGELTANETKSAQTTLQTLLTGVRSGLSASTENISALTQAVSTLNARQAADSAAIERLNREIKALQLRQNNR